MAKKTIVYPKNARELLRFIGQKEICKYGVIVGKVRPFKTWAYGDNKKPMFDATVQFDMAKFAETIYGKIWFGVREGSSGQISKIELELEFTRNVPLDELKIREVTDWRLDALWLKVNKEGKTFKVKRENINIVKRVQYRNKYTAVKPVESKPAVDPLGGDVKVGSAVFFNYNSGRLCIGTVTKISPKMFTVEVVWVKHPQYYGDGLIGEKVRVDKDAAVLLDADTLDRVFVYKLTT